MFSKAKDLIKAEITDPAVRRAIAVIVSALVMKYWLLDQEHADTITTGFFTAASYLLSRAPGKAQS